MITCTGTANPTSGPAMIVLRPTSRPRASTSGPPPLTDDCEAGLIGQQRRQSGTGWWVAGHDEDS